ncbi:hypothetical protein GL263_15630 [Streptomyces durbertensis]|uniref:Lipoprotein n=1 Tax=Streptomyces durbertensis TaxID=2448886 RepID=A0ABR6EI17_9ACTN|nr:hypothetical protein [Streptomyces durbertensis]MBB1244987.1 hypothetical protein [Streptomyces durbertensis]
MNVKVGNLLALSTFSLFSLVGCAVQDKEEPVGVREVAESRSEIKKISKGVFDAISLEGKSSNSGVGVKTCSGRERGKMYKVFYPQSFTGPSDRELSSAMENLRDDLPGRGWKIVEYGPNDSPNRSLTLLADHREERFSVEITHMRGDRREGAEPKLLIWVVSACYEVPEGQEVVEF